MSGGSAARRAARSEAGASSISAKAARTRSEVSGPMGEPTAYFSAVGRSGRGFRHALRGALMRLTGFLRLALVAVTALLVPGVAARRGAVVWPDVEPGAAVPVAL